MTARTIEILESLEERIRQQSLGIYRTQVVKLLEKIDSQEAALAQANENSRKVQAENENLKGQVDALREAKEELERNLKEKDEELTSIHKLVEKQERRISEQRRQVERLELRASWQIACTKVPTPGISIARNSPCNKPSDSSESESEEKPVRLAKKKPTRSHVVDTTDASGTTGDTTDDCKEDLDEALEDVTSYTESMDTTKADLSVTIDEDDEDKDSNDEPRVVQEGRQSEDKADAEVANEIEGISDDVDISVLSLDEGQAEVDTDNSSNASRLVHEAEGSLNEIQDLDVSLDAEDESLESLSNDGEDVNEGILDQTRYSLDVSQAESEALEISCADEDEAEVSMNETRAGDKTEESLDETEAEDESLNETQGESDAQEELDLTPAEDNEEDESVYEETDAIDDENEENTETIDDDENEENTETIDDDENEENTETIDDDENEENTETIDDDENEEGPSGNVAQADQFHDAECTIEISDESEEEETSEDDDANDSAQDEQEDSEEEQEYSEEDESD